MSNDTINFKKLQKIVQQYTSKLTGKPVDKCKISSFQEQILRPTTGSGKRTGATSQKNELRALALGIIETLGLVD